MTSDLNFRATVSNLYFLGDDNSGEVAELNSAIDSYVLDKKIPNWQRKARKLAEEKYKGWLNEKTSSFSLSKLDLRVIPNVFSLNIFKQNIKVLDLSETNITRLPDSIGDLNFLQELNLGKNKLTELTSKVGNLTNLQKLHLDDNKLSTLPEEVGKLKNLRVLSARLNVISFLPSTLTKLTKLATLDFSHNYLRELPEDMSNFKELAVLGLEYNSLKSLPVGTKTLFNLVTFTHAGNNFPWPYPGAAHVSDIAASNEVSVVNIQEAREPQNSVLDLMFLYSPVIFHDALGDSDLQNKVEELKLNVAFLRASQDEKDLLIPSDILKFKNIKRLVIDVHPGMGPVIVKLGILKLLTKRTSIYTS